MSRHGPLALVALAACNTSVLPDDSAPADLASPRPLRFREASIDLEGGYVWGVAIADLDRDGRNDLVATELVDRKIEVLRGLGGGAFAPAVRYDGGGRPR